MSMMSKFEFRSQMAWMTLHSLDPFDKIHQCCDLLLFQFGKIRHDRLEPCYHFCTRLTDRLPQVDLEKSGRGGFSSPIVPPFQWKLRLSHLTVAVRGQWPPPGRYLTGLEHLFIKFGKLGFLGGGLPPGLCPFQFYVRSQAGASFEIAGVEVGRVEKIMLDPKQEGEARGLSLRLPK